jgi:type III pantothenate kinase
MFIAIDIGNTHSVFGIYDGRRLRGDWRLTSTLQRTEDEVGTQVHLFLQRLGVSLDAVRGIGIASVVPNLTDVYASMAKKYFRLDPLIISSALDLGIAIRYDDPKSVGADRLCNAVAGFAKYGGPLIIIDFGTATTYDVVGRGGDYLGGVIAPGLETSAADLHRRAAKLPKVELHLPDRVIGTDTIASMQAGILYGAIDSMEGMVGRLQREMRKKEGGPAIVVATGGFSSFLHSHTKIIQHLEPSLVLDGIRLIHERLNPVRRKQRRKS